MAFQDDDELKDKDEEMEGKPLIIDDEDLVAPGVDAAVDPVISLEDALLEEEGEDGEDEPDDEEEVEIEDYN
jgi:hypothetical protein